MNEFRAVLLDLHNQHPKMQSNISHRIEHYIDRDKCVQTIEDESGKCKRIDLFLSVEDYKVIHSRLPLFKNIYFHLYCPSVADIPNYEQLYRYRAYVQVFEEDLLWVEISYAILGHDLTRLTTHHTAQAHRQYEETNRILLEEVEAAKHGVQPDE